MTPEQLTQIINEELNTLYRDVVEYVQFKLTKAGQTMIGRISQELINQPTNGNSNEKESNS